MNPVAAAGVPAGGSLSEEFLFQFRSADAEVGPPPRRKSPPASRHGHVGCGVGSALESGRGVALGGGGDRDGVEGYGNTEEADGGAVDRQGGDGVGEARDGQEGQVMPRVRASPTRLIRRLTQSPPTMEPAAWMLMSTPKKEGRRARQRRPPRRLARLGR